jgi:hypothetical protein
VTVGDDFGGESYGEEEGPASLRGMRAIKKGEKNKKMGKANDIYLFQNFQLVTCEISHVTIF